ncbi:MAG TPA: hypothetical protein VFQ57_04030 [Sphingomonas sp.]|nr:hypothetical protein [Sphingomonas sp.]
MPRIPAAWLFAALAPLAVSATAQAQNTPISATSVDDPTGAVLRPAGFPASPSTANATVSPAIVPQALNRDTDGMTGFDVSLGTLYASGDFGAATDTTIWSSALAARYTSGGLRLNASLPWMRIRTAGTVFTGIDATPIIVAPGTGTPRRTFRGLGDVTLGASYSVTPTDATEIEFSGRVKLNTATQRSGLSSGETDYSLGVQATQTVGRFAPFISATYRMLGDSPQWRLRNGLAGSVGSSMTVGERGVLLASYHYAQSATRLIDDSHEVFLGASTRLPSTRLRLTGFATAGLSSGAASASGGLALGFAL